MHADWYQAAVPDDPPVVLKLRLRPYSLGHEILLQRFGSPLVRDASDVKNGNSALRVPHLADSLVLASLVCSQTFSGALKTLRSPFLGWLLIFWHWRLGKKVDWAREVVTFTNYRATGMWWPETNQSVTARKLKSPWPFLLLAVLRSEFAMTRAEALDLPMTEAACLYTAWGEREGSTDPFGEADEALLNKVAEMDAEAGLKKV